MNDERLPTPSMHHATFLDALVMMRAVHDELVRTANVPVCLRARGRYHNVTATADYVAKWVECGRDAHGLNISVLGLWNEAWQAAGLLCLSVEHNIQIKSVGGNGCEVKKKHIDNSSIDHPMVVHFCGLPCHVVLSTHCRTGRPDTDPWAYALALRRRLDGAGLAHVRIVAPDGDIGQVGATTTFYTC